jgi:hypothetical protein
MVPAPPTLRACPLVATAGSALVAVLVLSSWSAFAPTTSRLPPIAPEDLTSPRLVVDPSQWWMADGNTTVLTAAWTDVGPECMLTPEWFRWTLANGSVGLELSPVGGASTNLSAGPTPGGVATVVARSLAYLDCGTSASQVSGFAESNITLVPPLSIRDFAPLADPVAPGSPVALTAEVSGGEPPYTYRLSWGDGSSTPGALRTAGFLEGNHTFASGRFAPQLFVWDSAGLFAQSGIGSPLVVDSGFSAGILSNRSEADVGVPVELNATAIGVPSGATFDWACPQGGSALRLASRSSDEFSCTFVRPGGANATFFVFPGGALAPASATYPIRVQPDPSLCATSTNVTVELGQPAWVMFNVTNGVPPFELSWVETGSTFVGSVEVPEDGLVEIPLRPTIAGEFGLVARAVDSDGIASQNSSMRVAVEPSLAVSTIGGHFDNASGVGISISASVTAGVPPYAWFLAPSLDPLNESLGNGTLEAVGSFRWSGVFDSTGGMILDIAVVDGAGTIWCESEVFDTLSPFSVRTSVTAGPLSAPGAFVVQVRVSGGLPPYSLNVTASDDQSWIRTWNAVGNTNWTLSGASAGNLTLELSVADAAGHAMDVNTSVDIRAPPVEAPGAPSSLAGDAVGGALVAVVAALILYWAIRRGRSSKSSPPPPDPVAVLRGIIEPADGADRSTVELLAEEAGVSLDVARSTLDRLIATGTVLRDRDADGGEAVSWSHGGGG